MSRHAPTGVYRFVLCITYLESCYFSTDQRAERKGLTSDCFPAYWHRLCRRLHSPEGLNKHFLERCKSNPLLPRPTTSCWKEACIHRNRSTFDGRPTGRLDPPLTSPCNMVTLLLHSSKDKTPDRAVQKTPPLQLNMRILDLCQSTASAKLKHCILPGQLVWRWCLRIEERTSALRYLAMSILKVRVGRKRRGRRNLKNHPNSSSCFVVNVTLVRGVDLTHCRGLQVLAASDLRAFPVTRLAKRNQRVARPLSTRPL